MSALILTIIGKHRLKPDMLGDFFEQSVTKMLDHYNALNFVDAPMLTEEAVKWRQFQMDIRKKYLLPKKGSG